MEKLVSGRTWAQIGYETGSLKIRVVAKALRRAGYRVSSSPLGMQITDLGRLKITLLNISTGNGPGMDAVQRHIDAATATLPGAGAERI